MGTVRFIVYEFPQDVVHNSFAKPFFDGIRQTLEQGSPHFS